MRVIGESYDMPRKIYDDSILLHVDGDEPETTTWKDLKGELNPDEIPSAEQELSEFGVIYFFTDEQTSETYRLIN